MTALVREVWQALEPQRRERQVELRLGELPQACGDIVALRQVWQNLLANALKFTRGRAPAVIEISGESTATEVLYQVRDNGAGFDPAYAAKLFGPFQRLHNASEFEGTGIGLTIVKRFIAMHDGRVWAEGKPDAGACFGFALPVDRQCGADGAVPRPER
jgi:light-regulated signal transduction histidine kinase (bacteriophytochrome)